MLTVIFNIMEFRIVKERQNLMVVVDNIAYTTTAILRQDMIADGTYI
jgi:hypothetical protein